MFVVVYNTRTPVAGVRTFSDKQIKGVHKMLRWSLIFLIVSLIAAVFGFSGVSAAAADIAKVLFYIFISFFLIALIGGIVVGRKLTR